ncbi:MAG: carbon monoxide dehydrogenase [Actinobacteria bacterium]|nr:carbon monoxide dehydrogenase [Actinomycetota bacterium]
MEALNHTFIVPVPVSDAWRILTDVERIAPCLPGAQLQEIEGDTYRGIVKVKVGPIQAQFKGQAQFMERDDANHRAVLKGEGRDTGGKGNASALITAQMTSLSATQTKCDVTTDLTITGKVAQFGRGAMKDISDKLLAQFVENLNSLIATQPASPAPAADAAVEPGTSPPPPAGQPTGVRTIDAPEAAPINLLSTAGGTIAKLALPAVVVAVAIVVAAFLVF